MRIAAAESSYRDVRTGRCDSMRPVLWAAMLAVLVACQVLPAHFSPLHAGEKTLYEQPSAYNNIVVTEDERGFRTLYFERGGARQSVVKPGDPDSLELPYIKAMLVGLALYDKPQRILIVGLGGGTLAKFLHKHYPRALIDAVDIDPAVVEVARKFFEFREDEKLRAHISDGRKFVEDHPGVYDLIFLDAYGADSIPYHLTTREFLLSVRKALTPRGVVLGNIWSNASNSLHDSMVRTYLNVFEELYLLDVQGVANEILIATARRLKLSREDLATRARRVSQAKGFHFGLEKAVEYGYRRMDKKFTGGQVLTDAGKPVAAQ
ncbi:MAG: fused MFS/spermidine synthase [Desulfobacterales bacterium]|nr:fused MFS/spermidine synthase [Desulfobacterales bacterium]